MPSHNPRTMFLPTSMMSGRESQIVCTMVATMFSTLVTICGMFCAIPFTSETTICRPSEMTSGSFSMA